MIPAKKKPKYLWKTLKACSVFFPKFSFSLIGTDDPYQYADINQIPNDVSEIFFSILNRPCHCIDIEFVFVGNGPGC
jgi:hypothetical protein